MSAAEVLAEFKKLPPEERKQVAETIVLEDESWIPESFRQGMADIEAGRVVDLNVALSETPPGVS
jgi:predicted transcriptional regulator